jgi:group I intron endonuclease
MATVYRIFCGIDNKSYVGITLDFGRRKYDHLNDLRKNKHYNHFLQYAFNMHGEKNFIFEVLESDIETKSRRLNEKLWMEKIGRYNLYNYIF